MLNFVAFAPYVSRILRSSNNLTSTTKDTSPRNTLILQPSRQTLERSHGSKLESQEFMNEASFRLINRATEDTSRNPGKMTYFNDLNTYLHQSSLLIQAYPSSRITTKYSLPQKKVQKTPQSTQTEPEPTSNSTTREKREPSATLTLKTFHPESGICLKYRTDKAQEVSRLISGLGRLAKGEIIEMPSANAGSNVVQDKMDVDEPAPTPAPAAVKDTPVQQQQPPQGGNKKKKKGKK